MNFYGRYVEMCNRIGKSPSAVAIEIGLSKPSVNRWKNGGSPTDATAQKVASYFGVSVNELTGEKENPAPENDTLESKVLTDADKEFFNWLEGKTEEEKMWLLGIMKSIEKGKK